MADYYRLPWMPLQDFATTKKLKRVVYERLYNFECNLPIIIVGGKCCITECKRPAMMECDYISDDARSTAKLCTACFMEFHGTRLSSDDLADILD